MAIYDRQINTALRLIKKYGQKVEWLINERTPDNDKPYLDEEISQTKKDVRIAFFTVDNVGKETFYFMKDTEIPAGAVVGYMGYHGFNPALNDEVNRDGTTLRIHSIDVLEPNGRPILYTVIFK